MALDMSDLERIWRGEITPLEVARERLNAMVNGEVDLIFLRLTSLPPLPNGLKVLRCGMNHLTELPDPLPPTLEILECGQNRLTSLPPLPPTLKILECMDNELTALPPLPPTLEVLVCTENRLTSLPHLPRTLRHLECDDNPFPQSLQQLIDLYSPFGQGGIDLSTLIYSMNRIPKLKSEGRNLQTMNILSRQQWDPTKTTINMGNVLQGNVGSLISGMLTGKEGSTAQQMTLLRGNAARLALPGTTAANIEKANALKKIQNQRKRGGSRKKIRKSKKSRKTKKE